MRAIAWVCAGIVLGFALGTIPGRREAAGEKRRAARLERELARRRHGLPGMASPLPGFDRMLTPEDGPPPGDRRARRAARRNAGGQEPGAAAAGKAPAAPPAGPEPTAPPPSDDPFGEFDTLVEAQRARAAQSRAALAEQAGLDEAQLRAVDRIVAQMNDELMPYGDELIAMATSDEPPRPRDMLTLTHDVTGILSEAQLAFEQSVGDGAEEIDDESVLEVWNYVDLERFRPYVDQAREARERGDDG